MNPRIEIINNEPMPGYLTCRVKTGKAKYKHILFTEDVNEVVGWLADRGIAEQPPAPEDETATNVVGGAV